MLAAGDDHVALARRWRELRLGCPAGCPLDHHECGVGEPIVEICNYCTSLDMAARDSRDTCWDVCPMREVA